MKQTLAHLYNYVMLTNQADDPVIELPSRFTLTLKAIAIFMLQLCVVLGFATVLSSTGMSAEQFIMLALVPFLLLELVCGGLLIKWYYQGIRSKITLVHEGMELQSMPLKLATKLAWSFSWRVWFVKLIILLASAVLLVLVSVIIPTFDAAALVTSDKFKEYLFKYDLLYMFFGVLLFMPRIHKLNSKYQFQKNEA